MAGRIAGPLQQRMAKHGLTIDLLVAMAATPPVPGLAPALDQLRPAALGLADGRVSFVPWLLRCLQVQNDLAGRVVISDQQFLTEYIGDFPVNLAATPLRHVRGRFVADPLTNQTDTVSWDYAVFPPLAMLTHDSVLDVRHALADQANWSPHLVQSLGARHVWPASEALAKLPRSDFGGCWTQSRRPPGA
jgi:hypothetical protein